MVVLALFNKVLEDDMSQTMESVIDRLKALLPIDQEQVAPRIDANTRLQLLRN